MELKITEWKTPEVINFNFEELKNEITAKAALYKNMVYTDETIKEAKADKASLNKFITALENKRKEVKKQCLAPYEAFEKQIKELVAIISEPVELISDQVAEYEEKEKDLKKEKIKELFKTAGFQSFVKLEQIWNPKWLNKSVSLKSIEDELNNKVISIGHDVAAINQLPDFSFEAMEHYKTTLDLSAAIAEGQRLTDIQRRKQEHEAEMAEIKKSEAESSEIETTHKQAEAIATEAPTEVEPVKLAESKQWIKFKALLSIDEAKALKAFCDKKGIVIESIA
ncbi:MAG: DUF1351 domain-containing protein [Clostridiales bacterium]|nr:DUF1351 domain-containing protein [Clostridiales bacterium]